MRGEKRNINKRGEKAITTRPTRYAGHLMEWHCCCGVEIKPEIKYPHTREPPYTAHNTKAVGQLTDSVNNA